MVHSSGSCLPSSADKKKAKGHFIGPACVCKALHTQERHRFSGHEFEQTPGDGKGEGSLLCCSQWGHKESDTTEQLNNSNNNTGVSVYSLGNLMHIT